ncbi:MAG TPA: hypothetical protein VMS93_01705 [Candidatus Saccharimonadales bacterium]|nr:hypothetical protein [Candidatus Saccharimonadales bacterium]
MAPNSPPHRSALLRTAAVLALLAAALVLPGCAKKSSSTATGAPGATAATNAPAPAARAAGDRFGKSSSVLLEALTKPTDSFHFSYKGQVNVSTEYLTKPGAKPQMGPVTMEADVSPDAIDIAGVRGDKKLDTHAKKANQLDWSMAGLAMIGPLGDIGMAMAFASPAAREAGTEAVGGAPADKFTFDTRTATAEQKAGMEAAKRMLNGKLEYGDINGTAWVAQADGRLVKFNIDAEVKDKAGNQWKEHHEGEVTPKK